MRHFFLHFFSLFLLFFSSRLECFDKVVIWGHKLHSHTHSYIHERFYRAFQHLGYPTYWFDGNSDIKGFNFSNSLFLTEGQADNGIPLREDCFYVIHNCKKEKYQHHIDNSKCVVLQVYTDDILQHYSFTQIDKCIYYHIPSKTLVMPWAADMLPYEIEEMKQKLGTISKRKFVQWIGTIAKGTHGNYNEIEAFKKACQENQIKFMHSNPWVRGVDREENIRRISRSYLAPAIVGKWQLEHGYIPCRIFISICCGQMGITNSYRTYELFDKKIVYNPDTYQLFYDAKKRLETWSYNDQIALMDLIKEKHTYINRIQTLLDFIELVKNHPPV